LAIVGVTPPRFKTVRCEETHCKLRRRAQHRVSWGKFSIDAVPLAIAVETAGETLEVATA